MEITSDGRVIDPALLFAADLRKHDGPSFMSDDQYGHVCTVTGATWTPHGRSCNGVADTIITAGKAMFKPTNAFTLAVWYRPSAVPATTLRLLSVEDDAAGNQGLALNVNQNQAGAAAARAAAINLYDTAWRLAGATSLLAVGTWSFLAATYDRVAEILCHNGVAVDTRAVTGAAVFGAAPRVRITSYPAPGFNAAGLVGQCLVLSRRLLPAEVQRLYVATRGRYQ